MFKEVWKHIVNQFVQGLIQYGKLQKYFYDVDNVWQEDKINSEGLSYIQIEEAFKKYLFLSISWVATRLNYFFNFGSQNNPSSNTSEGDIFLNTKYRDDFYNSLTNNDKSDNDETKVEKLIIKMSTCFPIETTDTDDELIDLIEVTVSSLYHIRNNVFHYKEHNICEILNGIILDKNNNKINTENVREFINRNIESIQSQFKEQIRSSGLIDYYMMADRIKESETEKQYLDVKYEQICAQSSANDINIETLSKRFSEAKAMLKTGELSTTKKLIELYINKVIVYYDHIGIVFNFHPDLIPPDNFTRKKPTGSNDSNLDSCLLLDNKKVSTLVGGYCGGDIYP